ncbi:MAG: hypothetical protein J0L92_06565 [Deltaproteobacteria bacterium]|nr:hypothetical protein [Deltaproteobacteria bacterium]
MTRTTTKADGAIAGAIAVGLFVSASPLAGCRCEEAPRPAAAVTEPTATTPVEVPPPVEPEPVRTRDGVDIAPTLLRQLESPNASEPSASATAADEDLGLRCARGCALVDDDGHVILVRPRGVEEDGLPSRIEIATLRGTEVERRDVSIDDVDADALEAFLDEGGPPPWASIVRRALGAGPYRPAPDLVAARARTIFSLDEYAPLVALRAPLADRWLYAEVGPTAYRLHLLRADRSVDRLLATLPLLATACDGDFTDHACIAPMSIDGVLLSPDGRTLHVLVGHPAAGHGEGSDDLVSAGLDDASALATLYDEAARSAELERSMRAPGARTTPFLALEEPAASRDARCLRGCALYRENGDAWIVRPTRITHGEVLASRVFVPGPDASGLEVLGLDQAPDDEARASILGRTLADAPTAEGRALVARQAIASTAGLASAARVELRAPHVGAQVSIDVDAGEYVIRWGRGDTWAEIARVPALLMDDAVSAPSLLEVFAPPDRGFPIVIVGLAPTRSPSDPDGVVHQSFHAIVAALPEGMDDANAATAPRTERAH